jgi:hypothetical protein
MANEWDSPTLELGNEPSLSALEAKIDQLHARLTIVIENQATLLKLITLASHDHANQIHQQISRDVLENTLVSNLYSTKYEPRIIRDRVCIDGWQRMPGELAQVALGFEGTLWGLTKDGDVRRWNPEVGTWQGMPGNLVCITCPTAAHVYGVNHNGSVFHWNGREWDLLSGQLAWIAAASDGTVVGCAPDDRVWRYNGSGWDEVGGRLRRIAVESVDEMIGVNHENNIFRWKNGGWVQPGARTLLHQPPAGAALDIVSRSTSRSNLDALPR